MYIDAGLNINEYQNGRISSYAVTGLTYAHPNCHIQKAACDGDDQPVDAVQKIPANNHYTVYIRHYTVYIPCLYILQKYCEKSNILLISLLFGRDDQE